MALWQWFNGFDSVEQFLYGTAVVSTIWFGLALFFRSKKEHWFREYGEALFVAVWLALGIRFTLVEVYSIPSESMVPTLLVSDYLTVSKVTFGWHIPFRQGRVLQYRKPLHGEVVIFVPPSEPQKSFVKRCVGLPGDVVEVRNKILFINGQMADFPTSYGFLQSYPEGVEDVLKNAYDVIRKEHEKKWLGMIARARAAQGREFSQDMIEAAQVHSWLGPMLAGKAQGLYIVGANAFNYVPCGRLLDPSNAGHFAVYDKKLKQPGIWNNLGNRDWFGPLTLGPGQYWMMGDDRDNSSDSRFFGPVPEENLRGTPLFRYWPLDRLGLVH